MTLRQWLLSFGASVTLVVLLMPVVLALTDDDGNSAWVQVEGGEKQTNLRQGDNLGDGVVVDGECKTPNLKMGLSSDLRSFRVGVDPDTCKIVVKEIVEKETETDGSTPTNLSTGGRSISVSHTDR